MKYCSQCGNGAQDSEIFCSECGQRFSNKKISTNYSNIIANVYSAITTSFKKLITKAKSEESKAMLKKLSTNKKVLSSVCGLGALLILFVVFSIVINTSYSPKNTVKTFKNAIIKNDINSLKNILYSRDTNLKIDDSSIEYIINYFNSNNQEFDNTLSSLQDDISKHKSLSYEGSETLLNIDEIFALTLKEKNIFFTKYAITIKPVYINIGVNSVDSILIINDYYTDTIWNYEDFKLAGPFLPGNFNITIKSTNLFKELITDTINIEPKSLSDCYLLEEYPITFFDDYLMLSLSSNVPDANVFVNGKDTGIKISDNSSLFGPISLDDKIYAAINLNGTNYKTGETSPSSYYTNLNLDFTYSDYSKISAYLAKNPLSNSNGNSSTTDDSTVSATAKKYIDKYSNKDFIIADSNTTKLDFKALNPYTSEELFIARNEILARHGYVDSSHTNLVSYFKSKSWYTENSNYTSGDLSEVESHNYELIKSIEFLKASYEKSPSITADYVLTNSSTTELKTSNITNLNDWELVVARNEIFARYGLEFSTKELIEHFKSKSWFKIDTTVGNDLALSAIENKNVATILDEEKKRINASADHDLGE